MKNKNQFIYLTALFLFITVFAQAQFKDLGVGVTYGSGIKKPGFLLNGQYFFSETLALAPSFIYYLPYNDKTSTTYWGMTSTIETKSTLWELNADVNYYFLDKGVKLFGVGGLNLTGAKSNVSTSITGLPTSDVSASNTYFGVNLGVGADFNVGEKIVPFVLMKYTISNYDQFVIGGGIRFLLK